MYRSLALLACLAVVSWACEDGVDNVIKVHDNTNGKGKILFSGVEIWTYDKDKNPACAGKGPSFMLPGHFKVAKGMIEVKEGVKEKASSPLKLSLSVEKQSWLIGVVCENGKSKNQFVPDEVCAFDLCKLTGETICGMIASKTPAPVDITLFASKDLIDIGPMPIPQLAGDWKISANVLDGKKVVAGVRIGLKNQWLTIETEEGGAEMKFEPVGGSEHEEL